MSNRLRGRFPNRSQGVPAWVLTGGSTGGGTANLDIDFAADHAWQASTHSIQPISSLLTCTRASSGYYTKADGTLTSFGNNVLRYGTNGLLVEEARTNSCLQSQTFDNGSWSPGAGSTVTANQAAGPDGTTTADLLTTTTGTASNLSQSVTITAAAWTWSIYVKKVAGAFAYIDAFDGSNHRTWLNLTTGTIGTNASGNTASVVALANSWYFFSVTRTSGGVGGFAVVGLSDADNSTVATAATAYLWGYQLELGAFPTSYIATTSATVTRAADLVQTASFAFYNASAGSFYASANWIANNGSNPRLFTADNNTLNEFNGVDYTGDTTARYNIIVGGVSQAAISVTANSSGSTGRIGVAYALNDFAEVANGGTAGTDVSGTLPTPTQFSIGSGAGTNFASAYIKRIAYWNSRLSNATLQNLTTFSVPELFTLANLDIDFVNNRAQSGSSLYISTSSIASLLTCTRASTGYYQKADGTLTSFGSNVLRYGSNGLLVEESRTNIILRSQQIDDATWDKNSGITTVIADNTAAPDGTVTADKITMGLVSFFQQQVTIGTGTYAASVYVKASNVNFFRLSIFDNAHHETWFNLSGAGSVGTNAGGNTATISALANSWYFVRVSRATAAINPFFSAFFCSSDGGSSASGDTGWAWGAQFETGSFATSYIPTTSGSATRAADAVVATAIGFLNKSTGSIYSESSTPDATAQRQIMRFSDASFSSGNFYQYTVSVPIGLADTGGLAVGSHAIVANQSTKIASAVATNDLVVVMSGTVEGTDATVTPDFSAATQLSLAPTAVQICGYIKRVSYWSSRLVNAQLQSITT